MDQKPTEQTPQTASGNSVSAPAGSPQPETEQNAYYASFREDFEPLRQLKWCAIALYSLPVFMVLFAFIVGAYALLMIPLGIIAFPVIPAVIVSRAFRDFNESFPPPLPEHGDSRGSRRNRHAEMVFGALRALLFMWGKFSLYMLPVILIFLCVLIFSTTAASRGTNSGLLPILSLLLALAVCGFAWCMQGFCRRTDTLLMTLFFLPAFGVLFLFMFVGGTGLYALDGTSPEKFHGSFLPAFFPYLIFCAGCMVYSTIVTLDTLEHGLSGYAWGIRAIQVLAVIFGYIMGAAGMPACLLWTGIGICGLLVNSVNSTSILAQRVRRLRPRRSVLHELFDPASPWSLVPVLLLEIVLFFLIDRMSGGFKPESRGGKQFRLVRDVILLTWAALQFGLALQFIPRRPGSDRNAAFVDKLSDMLGFDASGIAEPNPRDTPPGAKHIRLSLYFFPILLCMMAAYFTLRAYESPVQEQVKQTPSIILVSLAASIVFLFGSVLYGSRQHKRS